MKVLYTSEWVITFVHIHRINVASPYCAGTWKARCTGAISISPGNGGALQNIKARVGRPTAHHVAQLQ